MRKVVYMENKFSVIDVAAYILKIWPSDKMKLTWWKLQKLVYYCQAWSLVWDEEPLFYEKVLAWANGPVVKELYDLHKGKFYVDSIDGGDVCKLSKNQKDTIEKVVDAYGVKTAQWLSDLTHMEDPWIESRIGLKPGERGDKEITLASLYEYYSSIDGDPV